jgi:hypothetical protein
LPSRRTKAIVVLISLPAASSANAAVVSSGGTASGAQSLRRAGTRPPRARRRLCRYFSSALSSAGLQKASASHSASLSGSAKAVAEGEQAGAVELLRLVRRHPALRRLAHAVALHRLGEHDRGLATVRGGGGEGGVDLHRIVAAPAQAVDVLVAQVGDKGAQLRVLAEEDLAVEGAVLRREGLELAVDGLRERRASARGRGRARRGTSQSELHRHLMTCQPAPAKSDSSSSTMRPLPRTGPSRPLQVAVDDEGAVVELLPRSQRAAPRWTPARPSRRRRRSPSTRRCCAVPASRPRCSR